MKFAIVLAALITTSAYAELAYAEPEHPEVGIDHIDIFVDDESMDKSHSAYRSVRKFSFEATNAWGMPTVSAASLDAYISIDVKLHMDLADDPDYRRCTTTITARRNRDDKVLGKGTGYSTKEAEDFNEYWKYCAQMSIGSAMIEVFVPVLKDVEREKRRRARKERRKRRRK